MIDLTLLHRFKVGYAKLAMTTSVRLKLYKKISVFLRDQVPLDKVLRGLAVEYTALSSIDARGIMLSEWCKSIENAKRLSEAMEGWVPSGEAMLIQAGEQSGRLDEALENAMISTQSASDMKGSIISAMIYPLVLFSLLFLILYQFSTKAIPKLVAAKDPSEWPPSSQALYELSTFVEHQWWVVIIGVVAFALFSGWSMKFVTGPVRKVMDYFPPWNIYKSFQSSVFLISTAAMMRTGTPIFESMEGLARKSPRYVRYHIGVIMSRMESGQTIGEAMNSGFLDTETGVDIKLYGQSSNLEDAMQSIGNSSIKNSIDRIKAISGILNVLAMGMVAGFIGWIYYSFFILSQSIGAQ